MNSKTSDAMSTRSMVAWLKAMAISTNDSPHTIKVSAPMPSTMCCSSPTEKSSIRWRIRTEGTTRSTSATADNVNRPDSGSSTATKEQLAVLRLTSARCLAWLLFAMPSLRAARKNMRAMVKSRNPYSRARYVESPATETRLHGHQHNDQHL